MQDDEISCNLGGECKGWENCYYKQLKHKEQECEMENKYNTKDIRHINENNQEYIAEGNRMT